MVTILIIKDTILVNAHAVKFNALEEKNALMETVFQLQHVILSDARVVSNALMMNVWKFKFPQSAHQTITAQLVKFVMIKNVELLHAMI